MSIYKSNYNAVDKPVLVTFNSALYLSWVAVTDLGIYLSKSTDHGLTWSSERTNLSVPIQQAPTLAIPSSSKQYLVYRDTRIANFGYLYFSKSTDFRTWTQPVQVRLPNDTPSTSDIPSAASYNNTVYMFWKGNAYDTRIWYTKLNPDNDQWDDQMSLPSPFDSTISPAFAIDQNGTQHLVYLKDGGLFHSYKPIDTVNWSDPIQIQGALTSDRPALSIDENGTVQLVWEKASDTSLMMSSGTFNGMEYLFTTPSEISNLSVKSSSGPALAILDGRHHLVYRSTDLGSLLYATRVNYSSWRSIPRIGGSSSDRPALASSLSGSCILLYKGASDHSILHSVGSGLDGGKWSPPVQLDTTIQTKSGPSIAVSNTGVYHLVYQGVDDKVCYATSTDGENWVISSSSLGFCGDRPVVAISRDTVFIAWKGLGTDNTIYIARSNNAGQDFDPAVSTGIVASNGPTLVYNGDERLHMAYRGIDDAVYHATQGKPGESWVIIKTDGFTTDTPVLQFYNGRLLLFWKGPSGDATLWYSVSTTQFKNWTPQIRLNQALQSDFSPAILVRNDTALMVLRATGTDGSLHYTNGPFDINWSSPLKIPTTSTNSSPNVGIYQGNVWIIYQGSSNNKVYYTRSQVDGKAWEAIQVMNGGANTPLTNASPVLVEWENGYKFGADNLNPVFFNLLFRSIMPDKIDAVTLAAEDKKKSSYFLEYAPGGFTSDGPSAVVYQGNLMVYFRGAPNTTTSNNIFFKIRSWGVNNWGGLYGLPSSMTTTNRPVAVAYNSNFLNLFYRGGDSYIRQAWSNDGQSWPKINILSGCSTDKSPGAANYGGQLYLAWKLSGNQSIWLSKSDEKGDNWSYPTQVPGVTSDNGPNITVVYGRLHLVVRGIDSSVTYLMGQDTVNWSGVTSIGAFADQNLIEGKVVANQLTTRLDDIDIPAKICINQQTHKLSAIPNTLQSLLKTISSRFGDRLPKKWILSYIDLEGDNIMLSDENDFRVLVEDFKKNAKAVKILVLCEDNQFESEGYQIIDSDFQSQTLEQTPRSVRVSQGRETSESRLELVLRGKKIVKKLTKDDLTQDKREQLETEFTQLQRDLTQDEVILIEKHRAKCLKKRAEKEAQKNDQLKALLANLINGQGQGQGFTKINENYSSQVITKEESNIELKETVKTPQMKKKYPAQMQEKAQTLKNIFGGTPMEELLDFVSKSSDAPLEQLVRSYVSH